MNPYRKVAFYTLGCKLNFAETSTIARQFTEAGYARVPFEQAPDVFVINTCSVTDHADKKCRNIVNRARRVNPNAFVAVIGCYAQLKPKEIAEIPGVNAVLGANEKFNILQHLEDSASSTEAQVYNGEIKYVKEFVPGYSQGDRTRSYLKVQDGCNYFCAFCTIPLARGRSRSANIAQTMEKAREVAASEAREIVLTGVNIGDFGHGTEETFFDLVRELDQLEGIDRLRISSIEPNLLSDEIIDFTSSSARFVPHFHIPLQSGSDVLLQRMRRRYRTQLYSERVSRILNRMPEACIGVDVITGFPGETEAEFMKTYNFLQELPIGYLHVFTYSERNNTTALRLDGVVPMEVRQERTHRLRILSEKKRRAFYQSQLGKEKKVLFEAANHEGWIHGFTDNYVKVKLPYSESLENQIVPVLLSSIDPDGIVEGKVGEMVVK